MSSPVSSSPAPSASQPAAPRAAHAPLVARATVVFAVLALAKLAMLVAFRKHLFEMHWRVDVEGYDWTNELAFYVLPVVTLANLWLFGERVRPRGLRAVRAANFTVLLLCGLLILLTFYDDSPQIHQPPWTDPRWYATGHLFTAPPYLAVWLGAYALGYWKLVRDDREEHALRLTALFAGGYVALGMHEFAATREVVLTLDALGVAAALGAALAKRPLRARWLLAPAAWVALTVLLYRPFVGDLSHTGGAAGLMLTIAALALGLAAAVQWREGNLPACTWLVPFVVPAFVLLTNSNFDALHGMYNAMCNCLTTPRYFVGELATALAVFGAGWAYRRVRPRGSLWWLDALVLLLIAFTLVDARLSQVMHVRLDWPALSLSLGETPAMMLKLLRPYLPQVLAGVALTAVSYAALLAGIQRRGVEPVVAWARGNGAEVAFVLAAFALSGLAGAVVMTRDKARQPTWAVIAGTSPLWQHLHQPRLDAPTFTRTAQRLGLWSTPAAPSTLPASERAAGMNVVLIFQESTYNKYLSLFDGTQETQPLLSQYRDRMELFPNFFSTFAGSINARFATFTGLYPVSDYNAFTTHRVPVKSVFELLHERGYATSMFYSSSYDYTAFRDFLRGRGLDVMLDADTLPGRTPEKSVSWGVREEVTLGAIEAQIAEYGKSQKPFFLTYVPAAPHNPFDGIPKQFQRYPQGPRGDFTAPYLNELLYMDWVISTILKQLEATGQLDHTVVVITDDHAEMLGVNGGPIGHGWAVSPELTNVPLIVMNPKRRGYRLNPATGSQVDLLPTLAELLDAPLPADELYQGVSLYSAAAQPKRKIYLSSFQQYGIIDGSTFVCGDRGSEESGQAPSPHELFSIHPDGQRTTFERLEEPPADLDPADLSIGAFDDFQGNLLENYDYYRALMRKRG